MLIWVASLREGLQDLYWGMCAQLRESSRLARIPRGLVLVPVLAVVV